jgi:hypothetical protein
VKMAAEADATTSSIDGGGNDLVHVSSLFSFPRELKGPGKKLLIHKTGEQGGCTHECTFRLFTHL